ncbi:A/G-specific adenine glycosylase [Heliophilum fasciatum]|uniref:Adenine DNA glycosylase n=1 Tax=Heliophilum fasciatum TaxID=35700 RepID=A0A4R2SAD3_9FIRM|nr:A/G-specific adenine glycosylase [Heliophilum fasciatum]MCW2277190.1 A/G-specific adenine glycosylase [Heliophilum fasciatum]TCP68175.1 A/G-specific DNA-adenine glycosylase [Heliophilum fasciatum]
MTANRDVFLDEARAAKERLPWVEALLAWYQREKRDLPWRRTTDPYAIWVSEVMLQQTRVETVIPYYRNFLRLFPTVQVLAAAAEEQVLKAWEGLGYYRRVRHLYQAARLVVEAHQGKVPPEPTAFRALPGVGDYISGAVLSIAYGLREPAVDGNVCRVLARLQLWTEPVGSTKLLKQAQQLSREQLQRLADGEVADWTQALMELGALICLPKSPRCTHCPVAEHCQARSAGQAEELPLKKNRTTNRIVLRQLALIVDERGRILLVQRPEEGLLAGLWELPDWPSAMAPDGSELTTAGAEKESPHPASRRFTHVFSHLTWEVEVNLLHWQYQRLLPPSADVELRIAEEQAGYGTMPRWCDAHDLSRLPMHRLTQRILESYRAEGLLR